MTNWSATDPAAFTVQRTGTPGGGDFVRGTERHNAVRYRTKQVVANTASDKIAVKSSVTAVTTGYDTIELSWAWPKDYQAWTEVAIVRSGFGHPSTVNDGVTIYRDTKEEYEYFNSAGDPLTITIEDTGLQPGRWYYYTVFFNTGKWQPVMYTESLVPRNWGHHAHLVAGIPEYYRWVDARFRGEEGYLRQFLKVFGFELDYIREYVESWQDVYHTDFSPQPLLTQLGYNLGIGEEQGLGEIRTRALIGQITQLYDMRGTVAGLKSLLETVTKYDTTVTQGRNLMLLPDDAEFITGTGNWVPSEAFLPLRIPFWSSLANSSLPMAKATGKAYNAICVTSDYGWIGWTDTAGDINGALPTHATATATGTAFDALVHATPAKSLITLRTVNTDDRAVGAGAGVMEVSVTDDFGTADVVLTCGLGETLDERPLTPRYHGIPVEPGQGYSFAFSAKLLLASALTSLGTVTAGIYWYDKDEKLAGAEGESYVVTNTGFALTSMDWVQASTFGVAPDDAIYAIPFIAFTGRSSGDSYRIMGAMFYHYGDESVAVPPPDQYLTLGVDDEFIGEGDPILNPNPKVMGG